MSPISLLISGLVTLGVKPRLCRSTRRAFAFIHPLMLPSTSPREALLACPPFPSWYLLFFTVESALFSPCSRFDLFLTRQRAGLAHLNSSPLIICFSVQTALFLFLLTWSALAYFPTALAVALKPLLIFRQAQYVLVFPLKPAPFCVLFSGLGSTNKPAISHLFSSSLTLVLSSQLCPLFHLSLLPQTLWQIWQELSFLSSRSIRLQGVSGHSFPPGNDATDELAPDGTCYLCSLQSPVVCLLLSLVFTFVFSRTEGVLSHVNSSTHRFPRFPPKNLCFLVMLAVSSLVFAATDIPSCRDLISLGLAKSRILPAAPADTRPRTPLISFCTISLRRSFFGDSLSRYDLWSRLWGVARLLGLHSLPPCPHPSEGVG